MGCIGKRTLVLVWLLLLHIRVCLPNSTHIPLHLTLILILLSFLVVCSLLFFFQLSLSLSLSHTHTHTTQEEEDGWRSKQTKEGWEEEDQGYIPGTTLLSLSLSLSLSLNHLFNQIKPTIRHTHH